MPGWIVVIVVFSVPLWLDTWGACQRPEQRRYDGFVVTHHSESRILKNRRCRIRVDGDDSLGAGATRHVLAGARAVADGPFRLDLYHRLSFFTLTLPPLRERLEDIPLLARHFLDTQGFPHLHLSAPAVTLLVQHSWPGKVRELQNVILRAAMLADSPTLSSTDLTLEPVAVQHSRCRIPPTLEEIRREVEACDGNASQAARNLGIHRVMLYRRLRTQGR